MTDLELGTFMQLICGISVLIASITRIPAIHKKYTQVCDTVFLVVVLVAIVTAIIGIPAHIRAMNG